MIVETLAVERPEGERGWPYDVPAVRRLAEQPLRLTSSFVVLLGANGSGKSTLLEAVAQAYGIDVRGGHGNRRYASSAPDVPLAGALRLGISAEGTGSARQQRGFFLRAETAAGMLAAMSELGVAGYGDLPPDQVSHGEPYLQVVAGRFDRPGLYLLDEAEGPLSFESTLLLLDRLRELSRHRESQVVYATHSPLVAAVPGAQVLQLDEDGISETAWEDLDMVRTWRAFLARPDLFFDA